MDGVDNPEFSAPKFKLQLVCHINVQLSSDVRTSSLEKSAIVIPRVNSLLVTPWIWFTCWSHLQERCIEVGAPPRPANG